MSSTNRAAGRRLAALLCAGLLWLAVLPARAGDDALMDLQTRWAEISYRIPAERRETQFEALAAQAHALTVARPGRAAPLVWEGIIVSSWAGARGGLGALSLAERAKSLYEQAIAIDDRALSGSALNSLAVLYHKVPGWPIGFGSNGKAEALFRRALKVDPDGIDVNYFFGEYLYDTGRAEQAARHLEKAMAAASRPGRDLADQGRRDEARALLAKVRASL
jgi:tetratricopeptide (TPR) repeat protein